MKTNLWLTVLTIALVFNVVMMNKQAEGDCDPGIRKEHLDATPGALADGTTIEIGPNGLQVTDAAADKHKPVISHAQGMTDISTSSTSYVEMTDMSINFDVTEPGQQVEILFNAGINTAQDAHGYIAIEIDGTIVKEIWSYNHQADSGQHIPFTIVYYTTDLDVNTHTAKIKWKTSAGTIYNYASTSNKLRDFLVKIYP